MLQMTAKKLAVGDEKPHRPTQAAWSPTGEGSCVAGRLEHGREVGVAKKMGLCFCEMRPIALIGPIGAFIERRNGSGRRHRADVQLARRLIFGPAVAAG
jgi:hypothetical protein